MVDSFFNEKEIIEIGFKSVGKDVLISRKASFYSPASIEIGNSVRIDDFCILSGAIKIGSFVHISAFSALYGKNGIELEDYTGLSPRCTLISATDDFSGDYLIGPMVNQKLTHVTGGKILIKKFSQIGTNSVILPGVNIGEGVATGAMSLINKSLKPWNIYFGIPAKFYKRRKKNLKYLL